MNKTRVIYSLVAITFAVFVTACSTGVVIENAPVHSLGLIAHVVTQMSPRGLRATSPNRREYFSNYFVPNTNFNEDATDHKERAYSHILILGDRRPYTTEVYVYRERRTDTGYKKVGTEKKLAQVLAIRIKEELAKGREDRNIIDDFRAF